MPFFFPHKTKCEICNSLINEYREAVALDYIIPDKTPDLVKYSKNFVHRKCFDNWEQHNRFIESSFELIKKARLENKINDVFYCNNFILITINDNKIKIRDYYSVFEFIIDIVDFDTFKDNLNKLYRNDIEKMSYKNWQFSNLNTYLKLQEIQDDKVLDEILVPITRLKIIIEAILKV